MWSCRTYGTPHPLPTSAEPLPRRLDVTRSWAPPPFPDCDASRATRNARSSGRVTGHAAHATSPTPTWFRQVTQAGLVDCRQPALRKQHLLDARLRASTDDTEPKMRTRRVPATWHLPRGYSNAHPYWTCPARGGREDRARVSSAVPPRCGEVEGVGLGEPSAASGRNRLVRRRNQ